MVLSSNNNNNQKTCGPSVCNINGSGGGGHNNLNSDVIELTNENEFNEKVLKSNNIWMVNFYAPWCGWCQRLAPEWEKAAKMLKDTNVNIGSDVNASQSAAFTERGICPPHLNVDQSDAICPPSQRGPRRSR